MERESFKLGIKYKSGVGYKAKHISHICSSVKNRAIFNKSSNTEEGSSSLFIPCNKGLARSKEVDKKLERSLLMFKRFEHSCHISSLSSSKRGSVINNSNIVLFFLRPSFCPNEVFLARF
ncbi:PREDICTED: uncharacterized protein LOC105957993 isoform X2 [Erythranthe guttata]|uniref:uncharacterized protein LOC105957993 isoform X2 n=1 Tax=Erythranthe guttata TaxID=4155 RepID=UPI00064DA590|nr:PREDICTED: uncharacterized protein LOC105957993 isoform X2 [Erythranthe guttata]|eukprot:XP_012837441.1 PREDICTED: uncharacterized protein LOC105957993 isoform X2 [Erythranthe guttata]